MTTPASVILPRGVAISCQAPKESPLRIPSIMAAMAVAAEKAGAVAIRAEGFDDIAAIIAVCALPVIGIRKHRYPGSDIYITATKADVDLVADAGATIVALDATSTHRPGGETLTEVVAHAHQRGLQVMADLSSAADATGALNAGVDYLGTTLVEASRDDVRLGGPNISVIQRIATEHPESVIVAEGRFATADDVTLAFTAGAGTVVVGKAVTDVYALTKDLVAASNTESD
ncbi:N-acetylmannosamine-6-phosphate 2-epimerase [Cryobacterium sp. Y50]|uniref:N-acetylmannosamine-6-phosphate 2-epimerase n=1 Tax=Cryobacterium sp. Y50 TaxID=2048286 RepID=UPI000CE5629C|nr:putative N-acetylmannosamine-6-phosphate 2-epimerase [Cryobacterium sp. Y50]